MAPSGDRLLVEGHVQRFTDAHVFGRSLGRIEAVIVDRCFGRVHEILHRAYHVKPGSRNRVIVHGVELARLVEIKHGRIFDEHVEDDVIEFHFTRVPVHRIAGDDDTVVRLPCFQLERAAGNNVLGISPGVAKLFDGLPMNHAEEWMRH